MFLILLTYKVPIEEPLGSRTPLFAVHGGYGEVMLYRHLARCLGMSLSERTKHRLEIAAHLSLGI